MQQERVLVVDDDEAIRRLLSRYLDHLGFQVQVAGNTATAIQCLEKAPVDVVLTDVRMPGPDGMELLRWIHSHCEDTAVVMLSGCDDVKLAVRAMQSGALDYLVKPFPMEEVVTTLKRAVETQREIRSRADYLVKLESALQNKSGELKTTLNQLQNASQETMEALVTALDARERETQAHSKRVSDYSVRLANDLCVPAPQIDVIRQGSMLHDIGKIGIPDCILLKPDRLTEDEWVEMRKHPEIGAWIVNGVESLKPAADIVITHHERFDGSGYPKGLRGEQIPLGARVFAVADTLDAILSDRPYRSGQTYEQARQEIARGAGSQFDPEVTNCFLRIAPGVWEELRQSTLAQPNPDLVSS